MSQSSPQYTCVLMFIPSDTDSPTTLAKIPYNDELVLCYLPYGFDNSAAFLLAERQG